MIAGLLGAGLSYGPYLIDSVDSVNSVFDFGVSVVATVASILVIVGSGVAFLQIRRGNARVSANSVELNALRGVAAVVAVLVVVSAVATFTGRDTVKDADRVDATQVLMKETEFKTVAINARSGETLRLVLKNDDLYLHTFTIDELGVDVTIGPRGEKALLLSTGNPGTFEYKCIVAGHESMTGILEVS